MAGSQDLTLPFQFDEATYAEAARNIQTVTLEYVESVPRNPTQLLKLAGIVIDPQLPSRSGTRWQNGPLSGVYPLAYRCALYAPDATATGITSARGKAVFRAKLYLFSLVVAFEWDPSDDTLHEMRLAAQRASDFLYDVTNGQMAIGQVVIGGPELLGAADIQVMASNRLHPRAWIDALNDAGKFKPIRVGRGLWQKNEETLSTWGSPEGYRTLVHEWGHYAFGLADEYLVPVWLERAAAGARFWSSAPIPAAAAPSPNAVGIAVPRVALAVETLMASTKISEYGPIPLATFGEIRTRYPAIAVDLLEDPGPDRLPLPLPHFLRASRPTLPASQVDVNTPEEQLINISAGIPSLPGYNASSSWVFLLKGTNAAGLPERVVAQGKVSPSAGGRFRVLGCSIGDKLLVVSQVYALPQPGVVPPPPRTVVRYSGSIGAIGNLLNETVLTWSDVTPPVLEPPLDMNPFFVDVVPSSLPAGQSSTEAEVSVNVVALVPPAQVWLYPADNTNGAQAVLNAGKYGPNPVSTLDGHVLISWPNGSLIVCSYSQGGGPNTSGGGIMISTTGGSSEGNAMVFFKDNVNWPGVLGPPPRRDIPELRIVTTTLPVATPNLPGNAEARSYIFSLSSNGALDDHPAALVLYYDNDSRRRGGDLQIYRWNPAPGGWLPMTTYAPDDLPYLAIPLDAVETAPSLHAPAPMLQIERYRICWR